MRFYTNLHPYYCGIDLHARSLYVCILDGKGEILVHKEIKANPEALFKILEPYIGNIIVDVECMHCWYWVADWCENNNVDFIFGHALYMKAIHGGKAKNDKIDSYKIARLLRGGNLPVAYHYPRAMRATRDLMRRRMHITRHSAQQLKAHIKNTGSQYNHPPNALNLRYPSARDKMCDKFDDLSVQTSIDLDLNLIDTYNSELYKVEWHIKKHAKQHRAADFNILKTTSGVGDILALTILYKIGDITRFESVQKFASYSRLIKCKAESAGKVYGTQGHRIGNAHLKWAFSEAAVLYIRNNDIGKRYLAKLEKRMSKNKALSSLAYKLVRASEVTHLKVSDIDSQCMSIHVEQDKGDKDRHAMLSPALLRLLRQWWHYAQQDHKMLKGGWLFPGLDPINPVSTRQFRRACHSAIKLAGINKPVCVHSLRQFCNSFTGARRGYPCNTGAARSQEA